MALGSLLPELLPGGSGRTPLIERAARWAREKPDAPAYTFVDYSADPAGAHLTLSWAETDRRARAMAVTLRQVTGPGERAALLLPQTLEYMMTMLGALYSHVIAVPLFSPDLPGHADRLIGAYTDAEPAVIVTTRNALPHVEKFLADHDVPQPKEIVFAEEVDLALADRWRDETIAFDDVAYLQYTSGSTRRPAGVEITHGNVTANAAQLWAGWAPEKPDPELVSWLPLFHDMGLIATMALPLVRGDHAIYTDPVSFIMNPMRWLQLIAGRPGKNVYTAGPNFAYEYAASMAAPEKIADLDLSGLTTCLNGAEPIRTSTLSMFADALAPAGLRPGAQAPGYGLAEATVFVTAAAEDVPPKIISVDREALTRGDLRLREDGAEGTTELVSCGRPCGQFVAIVDPEARVEQPDGRVGEIWVHGPNTAPGYWRNSERSQETFGGELSEPGDLPSGPWMKTGDYGVVHEGELYVTGRIKDLIIVDGRNHYPQDIEVTAQEAHPAVRPDHVAAFALTGEETERLVIVAERNRRVPLGRLDVDEVESAVRAAVNVEHEMSVHAFVLIEPGGVSRTSSGKIARAATRQRYLDGDLATTADRLATRR
ncbi:acyl-CoA synthetase (AMP-forming)/AMP-acid ligase II [Actinomadura coerulea]|uniref:Acyl-CoA synthetase (AMP-forming)/AMP-acid ligase II n=1 Tax=Actinomadura coerulea TaxID=46159 RepID=A0A7X0G440_9ACTN|nr:fatty acyl-AMP ligase [Actinomadura coerulea]MBB6398377.1 acyl-CoA synthetase (AMP-forming)/AMP-acid ligase II [Actinomadura coerulea]GGQ10193.1 acyl-CoA synthetase [Actinomadura coerulea]